MDKTQQVLTRIAQEMAALQGHLGFYYKDLETGETFEVRADEPYQAASVIKLPLLLHVLKMCAGGRMHLDDQLTVTQADKMPSCGALTLFTGDVTVDVETLCRLMIDLSDNTATNVLIRACGIGAVNDTLQDMGLTHTVLRRLLFDASASARGVQNTVSPREMGLLLERLWRGEFVSKELSDLALDMLLLQQIGH